MPRLIPPNLLKKIKDRALDKAIDRINVEFGGKPAPKSPGAPGTIPTADDFAPADEPELPQSFVDRVKTRVRDKVLQLSPAQQRLLDPRKSLDMPTLKYRVRYCGQNRLMALVSYNGVWRMMEVYSYRMNGKPATLGGPATLRLYAFCALHNKIHSLVPEKIQGFVVTDTVFTPRWDIEVA